MKPIARKDELVIQELEGEMLVYDLRTNKAICLNQTSALVWQNCDGKQSTAEIAQNIEKQTGSSVNEYLIWFALNQLEEESLLENQEKLVNNFDGLSRREIIKEIGLTSMAALPIVASLVAPMAIHAQTCIQNSPSCTDNGMTCMEPLDCCSCRCNPTSSTMGVCAS